jgi:hypothetical protein
MSQAICECENTHLLYLATSESNDERTSTPHDTFQRI